MCLCLCGGGGTAQGGGNIPPPAPRVLRPYYWPKFNKWCRQALNPRPIDSNYWIPPLNRWHKGLIFQFSVRCTQVRFASFKTGGFITTTVHSESTGMKTVKSHLCGVYYLVNPPDEKMTNTPLCRLVYQACDLASIQAVKQSNFHPSIEFNITYLPNS